MKKILVICTGNSCRSIMAESLINALCKGPYRASSAGSLPVGYVHPKAIQTLFRHGIECVEPRSQSWDDYTSEHFDLLITVCDEAAGESCPHFLGDYETWHWGLPDPAQVEGDASTVKAAFESTYDQLKSLIEKKLLA